MRETLKGEEKTIAKIKELKQKVSAAVAKKDNTESKDEEKSFVLSLTLICKVSNTTHRTNMVTSSL
jgi:hypothetical protein